MGNLQSCQIVLDKKIYSPGELLSGKVILKAEKKTLIQDIFVTVYGRGKAIVNEAIRNSSKKLTDTYFETTICLLAKGNHGLLIQGSKEFEFKDVMLPLNIPTSCKSLDKLWSIVYKCKANVRTKYRRNYYVKNFIVINPLKLDETLAPAQYPMQDFPYDCCPYTNPAVIKAKLDKRGYLAGELIKIDMEIYQSIENFNRYFSIHLIQVVDIRKASYKETYTYKVASSNIGLLLSFSDPCLKLRPLVQIPPLLPPSQSPFSLINISYFVMIATKPSSHWNVHLPLTIGTERVQQHSNEYNLLNTQHKFLLQSPPAYSQIVDLPPPYSEVDPEQIKGTLCKETHTNNP